MIGASSPRRQYRGIPWLTGLFVGAAVLIWAIPGGSAVLRFEADAFNSGQWWRPITASLSHFGLSHLVADVLGVLLGGTWLESRVPGRTRVILGVTGVGTAAILAGGYSGVAVYAGLSGLGFALLVGLGFELLFRGQRWRGGLILVLVAGQLSRGFCRFDAGSPVLPPGVEVAHWVHQWGALVAMTVSLAGRFRYFTGELHERLEPGRTAS